MADPKIDYELVFRNCAYFPRNSEHKVIVCCKRSLKIRPKQSKIYLIWIECLPGENQHSKKDRFSKLAALFAETQYDLSIVYNQWVHRLYECRRFQDLILISKKAFDKVESPDGMKIDSGICYMLLGDYEKAMANFEEAGQLNPGFKSRILNEALAFCIKGEYIKAVEKFEESGYADPFEAKFRREIEGLEKEENEEMKEKIELKVKGFKQLVAAFENWEKRKKEE